MREATAQKFTGRVTQETLEEIKALDEQLKIMREGVRRVLLFGGSVEPGYYTAEIVTRTKAIPVKKYRQWLVDATSEGSVSRREKLVKRGTYEALVIR